MPYYCTVPRCTSMAGKVQNVSFHQFPRDTALAERWNLILKRGKPYTKYSKVCSRHFTPADYTMTNVGKNKGHWRTLRKEAVPSQNLPSESPPPAPYRTRTPRPDSETISEQQIQQQLAHAVYVQTMLAVHAANAAAVRPPHEENTPPTSDAHETSPNAEDVTACAEEPDTEEPGWHATDVIRDHHGNLHPVVTRTGWYSADTITDSNPSIRKPNRSLTTAIKPTKTSFKCEQCSKCFKDPDVFLLHKRWHSSQPQNTNGPNNNLLTQMIQPFKSPNRNLEPNRLQLENQILTAMRMNMESYIKNIISASVQSYENDDEVKNEEQNDVENDLNESVSSGQLVIDENAAG